MKLTVNYGENQMWQCIMQTSVFWTHVATNEPLKHVWIISSSLVLIRVWESTPQRTWTWCGLCYFTGPVQGSQVLNAGKNYISGGESYYWDPTEILLRSSEIYRLTALWYWYCYQLSSWLCFAVRRIASLPVTLCVHCDISCSSRTT